MADGVSVVSTSSAPAAVGPYTQGRLWRGTLFCSGQIALDPVTSELLHRDDVAGQVQQCLENLDAVARTAGSSVREHALRLTVYVADLERDWQKVNQAYADWFGDAVFPARVTFGVAQLPLGASVEIDAYIAVPG